MKIPGDGGLSQEGVIDALVVNRRRHRTAVGPVVAHDEVAIGSGDLS
jgi:hypothetical protein